MSIAHTTGPWIVNPISARVDCSKQSRKGGLLPIAQMLWPTDEVSEEETFANASLIAAAPDLLAELERMVACAELLGTPLGNMDAARTVIAKARDGGGGGR